MMKFCDLHTHSVYSDGSWTPAQLLDEAERIGLGAIALSDHNTVSGLPDFMEAAKGRGIEAVPGIEFSTDFEGTELHMLGLFIQPQYYDTITDLLEESQRQKEQSNVELVENLNRAGYALEYDRICALTADGRFNRAHVAAELIRLGYVADRKQAFRELLSPECGYYHPPKRMTAFEAIRFIKSIGAAAVLAHPLLTLKPEPLRAFLRQAVPCGLDGMETIYVTYDEETTRLACAMAEEFGLKQSGGSDFHGANKPDVALGVGRGGLRIPYKFLEELKKCREKFV